MLLRVAERQPDPWLDLCKHTSPSSPPAAPGAWRGEAGDRGGLPPRCAACPDALASWQMLMEGHRLRSAAAGPAAFPGAPDQLAAWHGRRGGRTASATGARIGQLAGGGGSRRGAGWAGPWGLGPDPRVLAGSGRGRGEPGSLWEAGGPGPRCRRSGDRVCHASRVGLRSWTRLDSRVMGRVRVWWLRSTRRRTVSRV